MKLFMTKCPISVIKGTNVHGKIILFSYQPFHLRSNQLDLKQQKPERNMLKQDFLQFCDNFNRVLSNMKYVFLSKGWCKICNFITYLINNVQIVNLIWKNHDWTQFNMKEYFSSVPTISSKFNFIQRWKSNHVDCKFKIT